jgi:hypothetical protein
MTGIEDGWGEGGAVTPPPQSATIDPAVTADTPGTSTPTNTQQVRPAGWGPPPGHCNPAPGAPLRTPLVGGMTTEGETP